MMKIKISMKLFHLVSDRSYLVSLPLHIYLYTHLSFFLLQRLLMQEYQNTAYHVSMSEKDPKDEPFCKLPNPNEGLLNREKNYR